MNITKYQLAITAHDKTIRSRKVDLVKQKAVADTYKVRFASKEESHKSKCHEWQVEHDAAAVFLNGWLDIKKTAAIAERSKALTATHNSASKQLM
jgi:hypothetical protein